MNEALHLQRTIEWLTEAQDARAEDRGVSAAFHLFRGWRPSYPETTGYIINTLIACSDRVGDPSLLLRAVEAGEWLLQVQLASGAFPGGYATADALPRVFNTGMILFGLSGLTRATGEPRFAAAGRRALDWLTSTQDPDGSWTSVSPERQPHAYHSRVAWGMVEMATELSPECRPQAVASARRAVEWVVGQQDADGWFRHNGLIDGLPPVTHNIAYTLRGLLEVGAAWKESRYVDAAQRAAEALWRDWREHGFLASSYGPGWVRGPLFRCLTGEAQVGLVWIRLAQLSGDRRFTDAAHRIAASVAAVQRVDSRIAGVRGGIPGAWPLWGRYVRFAYPNWAAKFFADLLLELGTSRVG